MLRDRVSVTMKHVSTVTSKGQVLIPVEIRKTLGIKPLDRITFIVSGNSMVAKKTPDIEMMFGSVKAIKKLTDRELETAIEKATDQGMIGDL